MSHVWGLKGPVWVVTPLYGSAFKTTVRGSCGPSTGARAVTTECGRLVYGRRTDAKDSKNTDNP